MILTFSPLDLTLLAISIVISIWAQIKVKGAYNKYSQLGVRSGVTGAEIARWMMRQEGVSDVNLECIPGQMTDHYDPRDKTVRLSEDVYHGHSIAALGIAAHEVGHVFQHAQGYAPMHWRQVVYPVSSIGSTLAFPLIFIGLFAGEMGGMFLTLGIWCFAGAVVFTVITLPVEFNASTRAMRALASGGVMTEDELQGARKVLNAAAMTYVAAAAAAILTLLRLILIARGQN